MKKLLLSLIILFSYGCHFEKEGKLVPNRPAILLGKDNIAMEYSTLYSFHFYVNGDLYGVSVTKEFYDRYNVGDTLHGYQVIPNE